MARQYGARCMVDHMLDARSHEPLLSLEQIELTFWRRNGLLGRQRMRVLDDVTLAVQRGEILGLVGESGSGKTTLGKTIVQLYRPRGRILYGGNDLAAMSERALRPIRRNLQMVFQDPLSSFNPHFSVGASVALPLRLHGMASAKSARKRVSQLFEQVGLNVDHADRFPHELSGGQLQRVAIARVLGLEPELIVADEAVSKLDVSVRAQILNLIRRTNRASGIGFIFITHDLSVARFLCDRIAVMYCGRIVEIGETERVFGDPHHPYTARLIDARKGLDAVELDNAAGDAPAARAVCAFAPRCSRRQARCAEEQPALTGKAFHHAVACFHPMGPSMPAQLNDVPYKTVA
jgi:oligopeptide transport system ATP-binding protein